MLRMIAKSKRGRKQLKRHGDVWIPIEANPQVGCLGGVPGIKLMSIRDRATFWMKVQEDLNLVPVERLDNFGRPMRGKSEVSLGELIEQGERLRRTDPTKPLDEQISDAARIKQCDEKVMLGKHADGTETVIPEYHVTGATSGRTSASGEPNQSAVGDSANDQSPPQATTQVAA